MAVCATDISPTGYAWMGKSTVTRLGWSGPCQFFTPRRRCLGDISKGHFHVFEVSVTATDNLVHHLEILARPMIDEVTIVCIQRRDVDESQKTTQG